MQAGLLVALRDLNRSVCCQEAAMRSLVTQPTFSTVTRNTARLVLQYLTTFLITENIAVHVRNSEVIAKQR